MTIGKKESQFTVKTTIVDNEFVRFFTPGQNLAISFSDFKLSLGVTGTLNQAGDPLGAPILDNASPTENNIRNIESGSGILANVSAQNGVIIKTDFVQGSAGITLIKSLTDKQQLFRSLIAGNGISIDNLGDDIRITAIEAVISTKTVVISQLSDFPAPVGGVITLEPLTKYQIVNDITTPDRFVMQNRTVLYGDSTSLSLLTYTGSDTMFTWVDSTVDFGDLRVTAPLATIFSGNSAGNPSAAFIMQRVSFEVCESIGIIGDTFAIRWTDIAFFDVSISGFMFTGSQGFILIEASFISQDAGVVLDFGTSTFNGFTFINSVITTTGSVIVLSGLTNSGNVNAGGIGTIVNNRFQGNLTVNDIGPDDANWQFSLNDTIPDTRPDTLLSMQGNITDTVITVSGTPVLVAGLWAVETTSQMTGDTSGKTTYNSGKGAKLPLTASVTIEPVSGGTQDLGIFIAINGAPVDNSKRVTSTSAGNPVTLDAHWQDILVDGDFVEVFVSNESGTTNLLVSSAILRIN